MIDDLDLEELRRVPRISYYFRYPQHRRDFHELKLRDRLRGHYAAKPLYGRVTATGHVDRAAGYNGDIATLFVPLEARSVAEATLRVTHIDPAEIVMTSGERNWPAIRVAAANELREMLAREGQRNRKHR